MYPPLQPPPLFVRHIWWIAIGLAHLSICHLRDLQGAPSPEAEALRQSADLKFARLGWGVLTLGFMTLFIAAAAIQVIPGAAKGLQFLGSYGWAVICTAGFVGLAATFLIPKLRQTARLLQRAYRAGQAISEGKLQAAWTIN